MILKKNACGGKDYHADKGEGDKSTDKLSDLISLPCSDILRDDDLRGIRKSHDHKSEELRYIATDRDRRKTDASDHIADNDHISNVVDDLKQVCQKQRNEEYDQLLCDRPFCIVFYQNFLFIH